MNIIVLGLTALSILLVFCLGFYVSISEKCEKENKALRKENCELRAEISKHNWK